MRTLEGPRTTVVRWLKFNAVGALGIGVQLAVLAALKSGLHFGYLAATALAVEAAVVHNFFWHERFTWADRVTGKGLARFVRFNVTTGALSILGNLALMKLLVEVGGLPYLVANGIAIAACSIANFLVSDWFVFRTVVAGKDYVGGSVAVMRSGLCGIIAQRHGGENHVRSDS